MILSSHYEKLHVLVDSRNSCAELGLALIVTLDTKEISVPTHVWRIKHPFPVECAFLRVAWFMRDETPTRTTLHPFCIALPTSRGRTMFMVVVDAVLCIFAAGVGCVGWGV